MFGSYLPPLLVDIILSLAWFASFGLLVNALNDINCGGAFSWGGITHNDICGRWRAAEAFSFLSAIIWLVSGILVCLECRVLDHTLTNIGYPFSRESTLSGAWIAAALVAETTSMDGTRSKRS